MRAGRGQDGRDRAIVGRLVAWFRENARVLPWREGPPGGRDPYRVLLSEVMLQQTQVARVVEKFSAFTRRWPTLADLAGAEEGDVLAVWSGLGYYRRARLLHAAAKRVVEEQGREVPRGVGALRRLPGVGRYTAGAVASLAQGEAAAVVDGNVTRVLLRVEGRDGALGEKGTEAWAWGRAERLVQIADGRWQMADGERRPSVAELNEGLMELGAVVCVPKGPRCGECPLAGVCEARRRGVQDRIPRPKAAAKRSVVRCGVVVVRDGAGRVLVERRGEKGMWAGMWQAPTVEGGERAGADEAAAHAGVEEAGLTRAGAFSFGATHRDLRFEVWSAGPVTARAAARLARGGRRWATMAELSGLGVSNAARRAIAMVVAEEGLFAEEASRRRDGRTRGRV